MTKLPEKLSECIDVAMTDLELCERDPKYEIGMDSWHQLRFNDVCSVCLAGSVMAKTLGASTRDLAHPRHYDEHTCERLYALNLVRLGGVGGALFQMGIDRPVEVKDRSVFTYHSNREAFKESMREIATDLREAGL